MTDDPTFTPLSIRNGLLVDFGADAFPTRVYGWDHSALALPAGATHFGMITRGRARLHVGQETWTVREEMFFVLPGSAQIEGDGQGLVISRLEYQGLRQVGGPLEVQGRLRYIDGCSDTLLVCPPMLGEPCLNHLHIPAYTSQSAHTHPSIRIGVILRGSGECRTPQGVFPLESGMAWVIPTGCRHSFYTQEHKLDVIAWHPDSDFGPTHENHPMINRTILPP